MKMQIIILEHPCGQCCHPHAAFDHNEETGEPQLTCQDCFHETRMSKPDRLDLLNRLNRASNTLSRHVNRLGGERDAFPATPTVPRDDKNS